MFGKLYANKRRAATFKVLFGKIFATKLNETDVFVAKKTVGLWRAQKIYGERVRFVPNSFAKNFHSIITNEQRQAQTPQKAKRHFARLLFFCCPFLLLFALAKGIIFLCHKRSRHAKQAKFLQKANGTFVTGKTLCFCAPSKKQAQTETVVF